MTTNLSIWLIPGISSYMLLPDVVLLYLQAQLKPGLHVQLNNSCKTGQRQEYVAIEAGLRS